MIVTVGGRGYQFAAPDPAMKRPGVFPPDRAATAPKADIIEAGTVEDTQKARHRPLGR